MNQTTLIFILGGIQALGALVSILNWIGIIPSQLLKVRPSMTGRWKLVLGLGLFAGSFLFSVVGWYRSTHQDLLHWHITQAQEQVVYNQSYQNESVEIDGSLQAQRVILPQ